MKIAASLRLTIGIQELQQLLLSRLAKGFKKRRTNRRLADNEVFLALDGCLGFFRRARQFLSRKFGRRVKIIWQFLFDVARRSAFLALPSAFEVLSWSEPGTVLPELKP